MDKKEFELWKSGLTETEQKDTTGFFTVIKRHDSKSFSSLAELNRSDQTKTSDDLLVVPYSKEYRASLEKAAELLQKASECSDSPSLKNLLRTKANAFLSNDYYESDIALMELVATFGSTVRGESPEETLQMIAQGHFGGRVNGTTSGGGTYSPPLNDDFNPFDQ